MLKKLQMQLQPEMGAGAPSCGYGEDISKEFSSFMFFSTQTD